MISNDIGFPDLELLQMNMKTVTSSVKSMREMYCFHALMLIYSFRAISDLNAVDVDYTEPNL